MEFTYSGLCELIAYTGLYRQIAAHLTKANILLSREDFVRHQFAVLVDCEDMLAIASRGKPLNLMLTRRAQPGGLRERIDRN